MISAFRIKLRREAHADAGVRTRAVNSRIRGPISVLRLLYFALESPSKASNFRGQLEDIQYAATETGGARVVVLRGIRKSGCGSSDKRGAVSHGD
jgi:hypothetical protein